jgi:hypothetical protein
MPVAEKSETDENDIIFSIKKYFEYEISLCRYEIKSAITRLIIHFAIAVAAFFLRLMLNSVIPEESTAVYQFFDVGLSVGIWVLLLIGISRFTFRIQTQTTIIRLCRSIMKSPIEFNYIKGNKRGIAYA